MISIKNEMNSIIMHPMSENYNDGVHLMYLKVKDRVIWYYASVISNALISLDSL